MSLGIAVRFRIGLRKLGFGIFVLVGVVFVVSRQYRRYWSS